MQGVKRGSREMADLILVNKADGDLKPAATRTVADYAGALRLLRKRPQDPDGFPKALPVSAVTGDGLEGAWSEMQALARWRKDHGWWDRRRAEQAAHWFEEEVRAGLLSRLRDDPDLRKAMAAMAEAVAEGQMTPDSAAADILKRLRS